MRPGMHDAFPPGRNLEEDDMRTILVVLSLVAASSQAAYAQRARDNNASQQQSQEQRCREMVGKEATESQGRTLEGQLQAQRFSECMMGRQ